MTCRPTSRRRLPLAGLGLVPVLAVALLLVAAPSASAATGFLPGSDPGFVPPDGAGTALADFGPVPWSGYSFWVDRRGTYSVSSEAGHEPFAGRVLLYRGPMDADDPLDRLIAVSDYDETGAGTSFEVVLEAGVIYYLTTTYASDDEILFLATFSTAAGGPGQSRTDAAAFPCDDGS